MEQPKQTTTPQYFVMHNGQQIGPYSETEIVIFIQQGHLNAESIIRNTLDQGWSRLAQALPALFPLGTSPQHPVFPFASNPKGVNQSAQANMPKEVGEWSWAAFLWGPIWAIAHSVWWGLLAFIPYVGFAVNIALGFRGRRSAWEAGSWQNAEKMCLSEAKWVKVWLIIMGLFFVFGLVVAAIVST